MFLHNQGRGLGKFDICRTYWKKQKKRRMQYETREVITFSACVMGWPFMFYMQMSLIGNLIILPWSLEGVHITMNNHNHVGIKSHCRCFFTGQSIELFVYLNFVTFLFRITTLGRNNGPTRIYFLWVSARNKCIIWNSCWKST